MENVIKLFDDWEIQLLVLLSFAIQIFLFFTGGRRWCTNNMFLRLSIWIAYLGADIVAIYALGYLSRHKDATTGRDTFRATHPLAYFWAPFLLIHLGGQDTITAFAMEDNKLWLRHLLNLLLQVVLAIYVFWKSIGRNNVKLIVSGIFVFIAGIIKYGERTWSLRCGSFESLEESAGNRYEHRLPEVTVEDASYPMIVCKGLRSMVLVHKIFAGAFFFDEVTVEEAARGLDIPLKVLEIELGVMYHDLYTKALVLRTRSGIVLRCISQMCAVVAFILFLAGDKRSYSTADIAITYSLFIGSFFLEVCAVIFLVASPWTWAWLKVRNYDRLARFSWLLFSSDLIGWPEKRPLWSSSMGQYNFFGWLGSGHDKPRSFKQQSMRLVRKLATLFRVEGMKIFWVSKLLDTEYAKADEMMGCVLEVLKRLRDPKEWPNLGSVLGEELVLIRKDFGFGITFLHLITEAHLSKFPDSSDSAALVEVCRKLSRYMMYLLVHHPSLLPIASGAVDTRKNFLAAVTPDDIAYLPGGVSLGSDKETLEEIKELWLRLMIYAASKSRPEMHVGQLAKGGELLTFVWLLLAKNGFGSFIFSRTIELSRGQPLGGGQRAMLAVLYILDVTPLDTN